MFTLGMTTLVALVLSGLFYSTRDMATENEDVFNKRAILTSIADYLPTKPADLSKDEVLSIFDKQMEQVVINMDGDELDGITAEEVDMKAEKKKPEAERMLPVYIYNAEGEKLYIIA
ncbi:MAG: NADH:ubiquinone reductase (Na(+)-transporting) subunit C, partial [Bacteroidota bacterium]